MNGEYDSHRREWRFCPRCGGSEWLHCGIGEWELCDLERTGGWLDDDLPDELPSFFVGQGLLQCGDGENAKPLLSDTANAFRRQMGSY